MYKLNLPADCPLDGAEENEISLYRLTRSNSLTDDDLRSYTELYPSRTEAKKCKAYGLSLYRTKEQAIEAYRAAAARNKNLGSHVAKVVIEKRHGKVYTEDDKHHTLWLYQSISSKDITCLEISPVEATPS